MPVLAGSAAYAFGEAQGWKCGTQPWEASAFYGVIAAATLFGIGIGFSPVDPMRALFWSAVIDGFAAVPIMAAMMWLAGRRDRSGVTRSLPLFSFWLVSHCTDGSSCAFYAGILMECALAHMQFGFNGKIAFDLLLCAMASPIASSTERFPPAVTGEANRVSCIEGDQSGHRPKAR